MDQVVPELADVMVMDGFEPDGKPRLRPPHSRPTLRQLLTHTAGFSYSLWCPELQRLQQCEDRPRDAPMVFEPGARWEYGVSIDWVGRIVERISGSKLEDYFRQLIFEPLGMRDTSFAVGADVRTRLSGSHQRLENGSVQVLVVSPPAAVPESCSGGGGLYSTGADYIRFMRMLLGGGILQGQRILQPETVADMARKHIGELSVQPLRTLSPLTSCDIDFFPGMEKKWGLGGLINTVETPPGRSAGSWAWAGLSNTYFWIDPVRRSPVCSLHRPCRSVTR